MTSVRAVGAAALAAVLAPAVGCSDPGNRDSMEPVVRRDSAGIEIVENRAPVHPDSPWLVIPDAPMVSIGAWDGPEAEMFGMVRETLLLSDGTVVVADLQALELRWFDSAGAHVRTSGGEGQGPGEFRGLGRLLRLSGDTVAAWDWAQRRMTAPGLSAASPMAAGSSAARASRGAPSDGSGPGRSSIGGAPLAPTWAPWSAFRGRTSGGTPTAASGPLPRGGAGPQPRGTADTSTPGMVTTTRSGSTSPTAA